MRNKAISKFEVRTTLGLASVSEAAGYGAAGTQASEHDTQAFRLNAERLALVMIAPVLLIGAFAGIMFTLAG